MSNCTGTIVALGGPPQLPTAWAAGPSREGGRQGSHREQGAGGCRCHVNTTSLPPRPGLPSISEVHDLGAGRMSSLWADLCRIWDRALHMGWAENPGCKTQQCSQCRRLGRCRLCSKNQNMALRSWGVTICSPKPLALQWTPLPCGPASSADSAIYSVFLHTSPCSSEAYDPLT